MQPPDQQPQLEAFLVLEQPRQRLIHWSSALGSLDDGRAPPLVAISAYYDPTTDQALIGLRYDAATLGREKLAFVIEIALLAEIGMIQPAELTDGDRRRFLGERLARCTIHVADQINVSGALTELVRRIRDHKSAAPKPIETVPPRAPYTPPAPPVRGSPPPLPAARGLPRGDTSDPVMLVKAKGTRDDLPPAPKGTRENLRTHNDLADPIEGPLAARMDLPRASRRDEVQRVTSPNLISRAQHIRTVEMPPLEAQRMARRPTTAMAPLREAAPSRPAAPSQHAEPDLPSGYAPTPTGIIYARYLRSGRWVPIRIGALSLKGAALMAGALPRLKDHVDIALSFASHRALVRGAVSKVSTVEEAAVSGAATFSVSFQLDEASRRQLTALLTAARAANVTIKPPPPRHVRRYPVEWSVSLGTNRGSMKGEALDVSRDGLFVRPQHALTLMSIVTFSAVLDDGAAPVSGRAKVVRQINDAEARTCGLVAGYGLLVTEMGDADRERWLAFLMRIERRAEKRVLIGAAPARLAELQAGLAAAGYAVTGGTDPGALVQLASAEARPVDAALIDAGWLTPGMSAGWVESLFEARNVPCVTLHGDARRARSAIDKLLLGG
jgi:hypothetical protein